MSLACNYHDYFSNLKRLNLKAKKVERKENLMSEAKSKKLKIEKEIEDIKIKSIIKLSQIYLNLIWAIGYGSERFHVFCITYGSGR